MATGQKNQYFEIYRMSSEQLPAFIKIRLQGGRTDNGGSCCKSRYRISYGIISVIRGDAEEGLAGWQSAQ